MYCRLKLTAKNPDFSGTDFLKDEYFFEEGFSKNFQIM